jgi:hypothetical protein
MNLPPDVIEALQKGNKIEAIKLLRQMTKMGLAEAKSMIDMQAGRAPAARPPTHTQANQPHTPSASPHPTPQAHPQSPTVSAPGLSPGEVPRTPGGGMSFLVLAVIAVIAAWYFLKG